MLTPRFLEGMNGSLANLLLFGSVMFTIYAVREIMLNGFARKRLEAAIAILVLIFGDAVIRGWLWLWRYLENRGQDVTWMKDHPVLVVGVLVEMFGIICVIRVFAPDAWGRNVWAISTMVAIGLATVFSYL